MPCISRLTAGLSRLKLSADEAQTVLAAEVAKGADRSGWNFDRSRQIIYIDAAVTKIAGGSVGQNFK
jgi:hypothetical protein